jgi:hypothetical protein
MEMGTISNTLALTEKGFNINLIMYISLRAASALLAGSLVVIVWVILSKPYKFGQIIFVDL